MKRRYLYITCSLHASYCLTFHNNSKKKNLSHCIIEDVHVQTKYTEIQKRYLHCNMLTWICCLCNLQVFLHWRHNSTHHHHCHRIQNCYGNEAWKCAPRNFFHNISTKCTRDSAFSTKKTTKKTKKTQQNTL